MRGQGSGWRMVGSSEGGQWPGLYEGGGAQSWELCHDGDLLQIHRLPQASTFSGGMEQDEASTHVYLQLDAPACG